MTLSLVYYILIIMKTENRIILREMVATDFKLRYQDSLLGYLWSLARPLFMFGVLYVVFVYVFKVGGTISNYPTYLLLGIVIWTYFTEMTQRSVAVIVERGDLIRKIALPRHLLVVAVTISATINLVLGLIIVVFAALLSGADISGQFWLVVPIFIQLYSVGLGLSFILSALYVKVRDISYLWDIAMQAGFYATPILYPISLVPKAFQNIVLLNPVAQIIQDLRNILVTQDSSTIWKTKGLWGLVPVVSSFLVLLGGYYYFQKVQKNFAEEV